MSVAQDMKDYLEGKGFSVAQCGDNWNIDCPFCDDNRARCGFKHSTGQWNCLNGGCGKKGSFKRFQKLLNDDDTVKFQFDEKAAKHSVTAKIGQGLADKFHKLVDKKGRTAIEYLMQTRGYTRKAIDHFQLGSRKIKGYEYVSIPFWKKGKLVNIKFRAVFYADKKYKWRRIKNAESCLFHDDACDLKKYNSVYLCEAELDAISLYSNGFPNVVAATTGAKKFQQDWYDRLKRFKKIYLVFDNDIEGQEGARKFATRLGMERCFNVVLPDVFDGKEKKTDINAFFWDEQKQVQRHTKADFAQLVKESRRFGVRDTTSLKDALKDAAKDLHLNDTDEIEGLKTPWKKLNDLLKGAKLGDFIVVSAPPKVGKTTFILNWMKFLSETGYAVYLYCCEMKPKRLAKKCVAMHCKDFSTTEEISELQLAETNYGMESESIFFGYPETDELTLDNVCDRIKEAVQRYGLKFVCFDNLHFLVRGDNVKDRIGEVTRRFKLLAETLNIVFVLVVHPKKVGGRIMNADDLKDSSSIYQDLDSLIILHRDENEDDRGGKFDPITQVFVTSRWATGGRTVLYFHENRALYFDKGSLHRKAMAEWKKQQAKKMKGRKK